MELKLGEKVRPENVDKTIISKLDEEVFTFVWKINNFSAVFQDNIMSPVFMSPKTKTQWRVNARGFSSRDLIIGLRLAKATTSFPIKTSYTYRFLNSEMKIVKGLSNFNHNFTRNDECHNAASWSESILLELAKGGFPDETSLNILFRVIMHISVGGDETSEYQGQGQCQCQGQAKVRGEESGSSNLNLAVISQEALGSFLENGEFSDVTLRTKTSSFPASKIVLAAQSSVFKAMFLSEMLEAKENVVKIEDFSDEVVKGLLEFLYTGRIEGDSLEENAGELLKISEKYEVVPLKSECEKILIKELNTENAAGLFILATFHNSNVLKEKVVAFVKRFRKGVAETESFGQLKKLHPEILLDLYAGFD